MGKVAIGVVAFVAGGIAGALIVRAYVKAHGLELTSEAIGDKVFGEGSTGSKIVRGIANTVEGLA